MRLFVLLALVMLVPGADAQRNERLRGPVETFEEAATLYRRGDHIGARSRLGQLSAPEQRLAAQALLERARVNAGRAGTDDDSLNVLRAAAALEMEMAAQEVRLALSVAGTDVIQARIRIASELFAYLDERLGRTDHAAERWLTAIGSEALARGQLELAPAIVTPACRRDARYAPLLVTCGIAEETYSIMSHDTAGAVRRPQGPASVRAAAATQRHLSLQAARRYLERALAIDPSNSEAALRLGHVRLAMGDRDEAVRILSKLTAGDDLSSRVRHLANLFLGRAYEEGNRVDEAERAYTEAMRVGATQSTLLALAHVAQLRGRAAEAATLVERTTTVATTQDPWWRYYFGQYWIASELLAMLRQEAMQ